ncbi:MAG: FkbM family methyltransferase [Phycisphaerales bacterium]
MKPGDVAVDVGANSADWTYELSRRVGPSGFVYAFEADPYYALATDLAIRLMRMKSVKLFRFGLSDKLEDLPLRIETESGQRHSGLGHVDRQAKSRDRGVEVVKLVPLDSLVTEYPRLAQTALIKVDVEGFELFVVRGAARIIDGSRPFVILETGRFEDQGYTAGDLHRFFADRRYLAFAPTGPDAWSPTNDQFEHEGALSVNRLLVPEEKRSVMERFTAREAAPSRAR